MEWPQSRSLALIRAVISSRFRTQRTTMYRVLFVAAMLGISAPVLAQDTAPTTSSQPAAGQKEHAPLTGRKLACQQAAKQKGLRGPEMGDEITVCVEEAKLGLPEAGGRPEGARGRAQDLHRDLLGQAVLIIMDAAVLSA